MRLDKEDMKISKISLKGKNFRNLITFMGKKKREKSSKKRSQISTSISANATKCFQMFHQINGQNYKFKHWNTLIFWGT